MSRNGSGSYSLPAGNPVTTGTSISSTWANSTLSDIASALTQSVSKDGQTTMTGNLPMGNNKVTGLADGTLATDAVSLGQLADDAGASLVGFLQAGTDAVATTVQAKLREAPSPEDFGCVGDGVTVDTANLQLAINAAIGKKLYLSGNYLVDAMLDFTGWSGMIYGPGTITCKSATTIAYVLYFSGSSNVQWTGVSLDMGQTSGTLTGGTRSDSGFYLKDARDCYFNNISITNCKFGEPIYVDGTSSVSPSDSHGSKRIFFYNINCVALPAATLDDGAFINVRSDFYTSTGGGLYASASNGNKVSDYTTDATVAYQRTTSDIYFSNCNFENLDRFALFNVKNVHLSNVSMVNNYTRGLTMSPTCESVTWNGGKVSGNAAQVNANYACFDIVISNLVALGETAATGQRHALRCGFGSERIKFSNITGSGNDTRHVFVEGAKDVTFENVSLNQWTGGNTTISVSISGGGSGNTSSWVTDRIKFIGCDFSANYAFKFDDYTGTATVADGAVVCDETCRFNIASGFFNGTEPVGKILYHGSGTWALTLAGGTTPGAHTYTSSAKYRRRGDLVYVEGTVVLTAKDAAMAGAVVLKTLPFSAATGTNNNAALAVSYWSAVTLPANYTYLSLMIAPGNSVANLWRSGSGQTSAQVQPAEIGNATGIVFSGQYIAQN